MRSATSSDRQSMCIRGIAGRSHEQTWQKLDSEIPPSIQGPMREAVFAAVLSRLCVWGAWGDPLIREPTAQELDTRAEQLTEIGSLLRAIDHSAACDDDIRALVNIRRKLYAYRDQAGSRKKKGRHSGAYAQARDIVRWIKNFGFTPSYALLADLLSTVHSDPPSEEDLRKHMTKHRRNIREA